MCSIFGIICRNGEDVAEPVASRLAATQHHRGPDHLGTHREPGVLLGNNRLAIVDLAGGDQPIWNEDGSLVIVYNGELYNHLELRSELAAQGHRFRSQADTETVLHAFAAWGPACLERFNGIFAFAIWRPSERSLFLARDRLGVKPLYLLELNGGLAFASEAKALLPLVPGGVRPAWTALQDYFFFGYVPSPRSPFAGIAKLPAGHHAWFRGGRLETRRYFEPCYGMGPGPRPAEARERLLELLRSAVSLELMSDVPVGVFLSGGLDSSAVAWCASRETGHRIESFALRFEEATHDESADARLVAAHLGIRHHEHLLTRDELRRTLLDVARILDEPFGDSTVVPLLALSRFARQKVKVVLTGWGGDEIFAGYPTYRAHALARIYRRLPRFLAVGLIPSLVNRLPVSDRYLSFEFKAKRFVRGTEWPPEIQHFYWMGYFMPEELATLFTPEVRQQMSGNVLDSVRHAADALEERDLVSRIMHLDARFFLEGNGLFQADRMTMAASLEARVPLLNPALLAWVNALPSDVKMPRGHPKALLRAALAPHLPARIIDKPKKGFGPPSAAWTREVFADLLGRLFSRERVRERGIFRPEKIERLLLEHAQRRRDHGRTLWALMSFQLWYEQFIAGEPWTEA